MREDPWSLGGLVLLALLTAAVFALYRSAPQTVEEARNRTLLAARPSAFAPRLAQAEERLRAGETAAGRGEDSVAVAAFEEAAQQAALAGELAQSEAEAVAATAVWGRAHLAWAEQLRLAGTGEGLRPDDRETLDQALELVERVLAASPAPEVRARAEGMRDQIRRQLRIGPLEWLPFPR